MEHRMRFDSKHVVVTGGTGALGTAVVTALVTEGATVHIPCYSEQEMSAFALADHAQVHLTGGVDLTNESSAEAFYQSLPECWASIHIAGGFSMAPLTETRAADFEMMLKLNAVTSFLATREAVKAMRRSDSSGGRVVNVAARPAIHPTGGMVAYSTSKAAVVSMTQCLGAELAPESIFVNAIAPSVMNTPANRAGMPDADHATWPTVEQVASTILFLASEDNALTHGAVIPVFGVA